MRKRYSIIVFLFLFTVLIVEAQTRHRRPPHGAGGNDLVSAKQNVWQEFNARATQCGDSYFTQTGQLLEMKECSPVLKVNRPITYADSLNGILWAGQIEIECAAWRPYPNGQWKTWDSFVMQHGFLLSFSVWKTQSGFHNQKLNIEGLFKPECPNAPKSRIESLDASSWKVNLKKSDGWFDTGVKISAGQMLNVVVEDFEAPKVRQKFSVRLTRSGVSMIPPVNPKSPYKGGVHIFYMNKSEVAKYRRCLDIYTWLAVQPSWSDTVRVKVDDDNPVDSLLLDIILFPASFRKENPCMGAK